MQIDIHTTTHLINHDSSNIAYHDGLWTTRYLVDPMKHHDQNAVSVSTNKEATELRRVVVCMMLAVLVLMYISPVVSPIPVVVECVDSSQNTIASKGLVLIAPTEITVNTMWGGLCPIMLSNQNPHPKNVSLDVGQDLSPHSVLLTERPPLLTIDANSNVSLVLSLRVELDFIQDYQDSFYTTFYYTGTGIFLTVHDVDNSSMRLDTEVPVYVRILVIKDPLVSDYAIGLILLTVSLSVFIITIRKPSRRYIVVE